MRIGSSSPDLWGEVAQLHQANAKTPGRGRGRRPKGSHVFVRGMLTCGTCGSTMKPRIDPRVGDASPYEVYYCNGRAFQGPEFCPVPPIKREIIDAALYRYFAEVSTDIEATRAQVAEAVGHKLEEVNSHLMQAEREQEKASDRLFRVRGDYQSGRIEADDWAEQRPQLIAEREAANAAVEQLRSRLEEVEADMDKLDVESEVLSYLAAIRQAVVGEVRDAAGIEALRAALLKLFSGFTLHCFPREAQRRAVAPPAELLGD